jgi:hypothetical protein
MKNGAGLSPTLLRSGHAVVIAHLTRSKSAEEEAVNRSGQVGDQ